MREEASHILKYFSKLGYKTLFVVPQNNLSQNIPDDAVTTNKFFSIPVGDGDKLNLITASIM